ncbi:MAG: TRAP transporter small permease subunit [Paracoccaceae bacterium]|nr:TRAP transporter small permease subunit [Paracoccaceae bacterium]
MALLKALLWPVQLWNDVVLELGRWIAVVCIALMVVCILLQVFFRYVLNDALPWPDEAARFFMLWMTGLIAPLAYRQGAFVSIDLALQMMHTRLAAFVSLILLLIAGVVLYWAIGIGANEVTSLTARGKTASLYIWDFAEGGWEKMPRGYVFYSLFVGVILLFIVNVELILRSLITLLGAADELKPIVPDTDEIMAE